MEINVEDLQKVVREKIANEVMQSLDQETKEKVVAAGISQAMGSWQFKTAIQEEILEVTKQEIQDYLQKPEVKQKIREETQNAVDEFSKILQQTILTNMLTTLGDQKGRIYENHQFYHIAKEIMENK